MRRTVIGSQEARLIAKPHLDVHDKHQTLSIGCSNGKRRGEANNDHQLLEIAPPHLLKNMRQFFHNIFTKFIMLTVDFELLYNIRK